MVGCILHIKQFDLKPDAVFLMSYSQDAPLILEKLREDVPDIKAFVSGLPSQTQSRFPAIYQDQADHLFAMSLWSPKLPYFGAYSTIKQLKINNLNFIIFPTKKIHLWIQ